MDDWTADPSAIAGFACHIPRAVADIGTGVNAAPPSPGVHGCRPSEATTWTVLVPVCWTAPMNGVPAASCAMLADCSVPAARVESPVVVAVFWSTGQALPLPHLQARTIDRLARLPQVVIVAVHGHCYTGALELALAGDLIVCNRSASFADTHARWALTPLWGMSQRLPRRIGVARAREMMLLGRRYDGQRAAEMGLANLCFDDAQFETELQALVRELLAGSWFSHRATKRLLEETDGLPLAAGLAHEVFRNAGKGPDMAARIAAFGQTSGRTA